MQVKVWSANATNDIGPLKINAEYVSSVIPDHSSKYDWNPCRHLWVQDIKWQLFDDQVVDLAPPLHPPIGLL